MGIGQSKEFTYVGGTNPYIFKDASLNEVLKLRPTQLVGVSILKLDEKFTIVRKRFNTYVVL